jgi:hypothetical protein
MLRAHRVNSAPGLVALLVTLLVLGHICDLPAFVDVIAHTTGSAHHHQTDHHADDDQVSCDVVDATNTVVHQAGVALAALDVDSIGGRPPIRLVGLAAHASVAPPPRLPLFLLHRTLLI